ncbi:MAG: DUF2063 domain-containing protein, partial [Gammaproteobacteria bacterium CG_4_10_14_0_8_um_filter_38_16]
MTSFSAVQDQLQNYVMTKDDSIFDHVVGTQKVPKEVRLEIYENAYRLRLQEALATSYPSIKKYLGNKSFEKLCSAYIDHFPSSYRSIRWFGDKLDLFLQQQSKYKKMPHLSELATLEWKSAYVFDAENASVLQLNEMASLSPDLWLTVKFKVHPTVQRINLSCNIVPIWEAMCDEKEPPALIKNIKPIAWVLWRKELVSQYTSISDDEACALDAVIAGETFSDMCEKLCDFVSEKEAGQRAASLLKCELRAELVHQYKKSRCNSS